MNRIAQLCEELGTNREVLGAFVLKDGLCLGSSLPVEYEGERLYRLGLAMVRAVQSLSLVGIARSSLAFHWTSASLLAWPTAEGTVLGVLAKPNTQRDVIENQAFRVVEELTLCLRLQATDRDAPTRRENVRPRRDEDHEGC